MILFEVIGFHMTKYRVTLNNASDYLANGLRNY